MKTRKSIIRHYRALWHIAKPTTEELLGTTCLVMIFLCIIAILS